MKRVIFWMLLLGSPLAHATVVSQNISVTYTCTGTTGPFAFTFPISATNALTVTQNGTVLNPSVYTVVPVNNNYANGGSVTLNSSCPNGQILILERVTPITQTSVYTDNMPVPMKSFENSLDKLTQIDQETAFIANSKAAPGTCPNGSAVTQTTTSGVVCNFALQANISNQASGVIPLATAPSIIGAQSHLDDGVTTPNVITSTEGIAQPASSPANSTLNPTPYEAITWAGSATNGNCSDSANSGNSAGQCMNSVAYAYISAMENMQPGAGMRIRYMSGAIASPGTPASPVNGFNGGLWLMGGLDSGWSRLSTSTITGVTCAGTGLFPCTGTLTVGTITGPNLAVGSNLTDQATGKVAFANVTAILTGAGGAGSTLTVQGDFNPAGVPSESMIGTPPGWLPLIEGVEIEAWGSGHGISTEGQGVAIACSNTITPACIWVTGNVQPVFFDGVGAEPNSGSALYVGVDSQTLGGNSGKLVVNKGYFRVGAGAVAGVGPGVYINNGSVVFRDVSTSANPNNTVPYSGNDTDVSVLVKGTSSLDWDNGSVNLAGVKIYGPILNGNNTSEINISNLIEYQNSDGFAPIHYTTHTNSPAQFWDITVSGLVSNFNQVCALQVDAETRGNSSVLHIEGSQGYTNAVGSGYTSGTGVATTTNSISGTGATLNTVANGSGALTNATTVNAGGTGYVQGDIVKATGGTNGYFKVTNVGGGGAIVAVGLIPGPSWCGAGPAPDMPDMTLSRGYNYSLDSTHGPGSTGSSDLTIDRVRRSYQNGTTWLSTSAVVDTFFNDWCVIDGYQTPMGFPVNLSEASCTLLLRNSGVTAKGMKYTIGGTNYASTLGSVTAISGTGLSGTGTVNLTNFNNNCTSCTATVTITGGAFTSAVVTAAGYGATAAPTTATCGGATGSATCPSSGTATITTTLAGPPPCTSGSCVQIINDATTGLFNDTITTGGGGCKDIAVWNGTNWVNQFTISGCTFTTSAGAATHVASAHTTGNVANIGTTLLYAVPSNGAGLYQFDCYNVVTTPATSSSTLPTCNAIYTDEDTSVGSIVAPVGSTAAGNTAGTTNSGSAGRTSVVIRVKASTNINYSTSSYASTGATAMQYANTINLTYLGNY